MMHEYAEQEMALAWPEPDEMQELIKKDILQILDTFSEQGHSGMSGAYVLSCLDRLLRFKPLSPLTGSDEEWGEPHGHDFTQQNKRCSSVFRINFDNGTAYDIDGKVFSKDGGKHFYSCYESRIPVTFPYYPRTNPEHVILDYELERKKCRHVLIRGCIAKYGTMWFNGKTIKDGAFRNDDGKYIPVLDCWDRTDPEAVVGYAKLQYREHDGIYYEAHIQNSERITKILDAMMKEKDEWMIGIFANQLKYQENTVEDGCIRHGAITHRLDDAAFIEDITFIDEEDAEGSDAE